MDSPHTLLKFAGFETVDFPAALCVLPDPVEKEVRNSNSWFLCLIVDVRTSHRADLRVLKPYVSEDAEGVLYGWVDRWDNCYDHKVQGVHGTDAQVVAWQPCAEGFSFHDLLG